MRALGVMAIACFVVLALAACGDEGGEAGGGGGEGTPNEVTGLITEVDAHMGKHVGGFTLEGEDGEMYDISIASDVDYGFPLKHLMEHRDTGEPVTVTLEERSGTLYALSIDDA